MMTTRRCSPCTRSSIRTMCLDTTSRKYQTWSWPPSSPAGPFIFELPSSSSLFRPTRDKFVLSNMQATISDILNQSYPRWQSHQIFPYCRTVDSTEIPRRLSSTWSANRWLPMWTFRTWLKICLTNTMTWARQNFRHRFAVDLLMQIPLPYIPWACPPIEFFSCRVSLGPSFLSQRMVWV